MPSDTDSRIATLSHEVDRLRDSHELVDDQARQVMLKLTQLQLNLATQDKSLADQDRMLIKLDAAINGNGKPGLILRVDRLEQLVAGVSRLTWLLIAAASAAMVKFVFNRTP